jgi:arylsulfatase A-like enzyme
MNGYDLQNNGTPYFDQVNYTEFIFRDAAVDKIKAHDSSKPMLMHYHSVVPHTPLQAPQEYLDLCSNVSAGDPLSTQPTNRQYICGMVATLDYSILKIVLALASKRMLSKTLIVYHSDNGGMLQAGSLNTPYRGQKGTVFEGGTRVPAFMYSSALRLANTLRPVNNDMFHVADVLPTVMGYADVPLKSMPKGIDGMNHWTSLSLGLPLTRFEVPVNSASAAVGYFSAYLINVLGTTWKFLLNPSVVEFIAFAKVGDVYHPEGALLFNLNKDPSESINLINDTSPEVIVVKTLLELKTSHLQNTSRPSELKSFPPIVDLPPSPLGCWLPLDSPLYRTVKCPVPTPYIPPNFNERHSHNVGDVDEYDTFVASDLDL